MSTPPMVHVPLSPGPRPATTGPQPGMSPQDVVRLLKKRLWLIIGVAGFIFVAIGVLTFFWMKYWPSYVAVAMVRVKSPAPPPAMAQETRLPPKDVMQQYMNTQAAIITSRDLFENALKDPAVKQTAWRASFARDPRDPLGIVVEDALTDLEDRFRANPIRDSHLIRVTFSCRNGDESATVINAVLLQYRLQVTAEARARTSEELKQFRGLETKNANELKRKKDELERSRAEKNIPLVKQRQIQIAENVAALSAFLAETLTEKAEAQALYDMYHQPGAEARSAETPEMRRVVEMDPTFRAYTAQLVQLEVAVESARRKGPRHQSVADLDQQIKTIKEQMGSREAQLLSDAFHDMREQTRVQLDQINARMIDLQDRLADAKLDLADLESGLAEYDSANQEIERLRTQLEELSHHIMMVGIQQENPELVRVVVGTAVPPLERSSPRWVVNLPAGMILGILAAVGLAFLLEFMSTTVKTPTDVIRQLNLPLLGQILSQEDDESSPEDMNKLLVEAPHSVLAEGFRQLRTNFLFAAPPEQQRTVLVTSCSPEEGKTCVAVNLATALALSGSKTLLIDVNFRRPNVAAVFGVTDNSEGLSNVLIGRGDPETLITKTPHEHLDILAAGPLPPNPAELLGGDYLKNFLEQCKNTYQTIIFDGPPVLVVSDAMMLATMCDSTLLVVRAGSSARGAVLRAKDQLRRVNAKLTGVILNDVRITRGGYFREMYRTYYDYQAPEALPDGSEAEVDQTQPTKDA